MSSLAGICRSLLISGAVFVCLSVGALAATTADAEKKTPAQWVAQLGAEHLPEREEAVAALLALGAKARGDVCTALDSTDPEIKARATELWKTLRWDMIPGAEADIAKFLALSDKPKEIDGLWRDFNRKYGLESMRLMAEFHDAGLEKMSYRRSLLSLLATTPPEKVTAFIKGVDPVSRKSFENLLDTFPPGENGLKFAGILVTVQTGIGNYQKAFRHARDAAVRWAATISDYDKLVALCVIAVEQDGDIDATLKITQLDTISETDPDKLCAKLGFYTALLAKMGKQNLIAPLCEAAAGKTARADAMHLRRMVESLVAAELPDDALKMLKDAEGPQALYMRSSLKQKAGDVAAAETDWKNAMQAADVGNKDIKKHTALELADLMRDWHDPRAVETYEKVLSIEDTKTGFDVEACFHMGAMLEEQKLYPRAIEFYEKGLGISEAIGGEYSTPTPDGHGVMIMFFSDEVPAIRRKVYALKSRLPEQAAAPAGAAP